MKPTRVVIIPPLASEPARFLIVSAGAIVQRGVLTLEDAERPLPMRTVVIVPGADVLLRWIALSPGSAAQMQAAAAWRLRDEIAAAPDRLVVVLGRPEQVDELRLTAVISRNLLAAWGDYLEALGLRADVMLPDVLTLPEPSEDNSLTLAAFTDGVALRGRRFAAVVQSDLVEIIAAGRTTVRPADDVAEAAMIRAIEHPPVNLLDALVAERIRGVGWRRTLALGAVALLMPLVLIVAAAVKDDMTARQLQRETRAAVVARAPDLKDDPDPVSAYAARNTVAIPSAGVAAVAATLFAAVEGVEGAELDLLAADSATGVRATISYPTYSDMKTIEKSISDAGFSVRENSTLDEAGRVVSDVTIGEQP